MQKLLTDQGIKIENHLGLVHACCQRFRHRGLDYDDVFQTGCIGLTKAAKNFDENRGLQFSTYAVPVILGEIKALFRDSGSLKFSRRVKELTIKLKYTREKFLKSYEREPSVCELTELLEVDKEQILEALDASRIPVSLNCESKDDDSREIEVPVQFEDEIISMKLSIFEVIKAFEKRDKNLIYLRFFRGATQSETAKNLCMTQVQVSRREKILLKTLREKLA